MNPNQKSLKKSPEEWAAIVDGLPEYIKVTIAKIIWWDHFAGRLTGNRLDHLDWCLLEKADLSIPDDQVRAHLMACGYTEEQALSRIKPHRVFPKNKKRKQTKQNAN